MNYEKVISTPIFLKEWCSPHNPAACRVSGEPNDRMTVVAEAQKMLCEIKAGEASSEVIEEVTARQAKLANERKVKKSTNRAVQVDVERSVRIIKREVFFFAWSLGLLSITSG